MSIKLTIPGILVDVFEKGATDGTLTGKVVSLENTTKSRKVRIEITTKDEIELSASLHYEGESTDLQVGATLNFTSDGVVTGLKAPEKPAKAVKTRTSGKQTPDSKADFF